MSTSILKPGLLVSVKTSIRGGVTYRRVDLDARGVAEDGASEGSEVTRWETTRVVTDPEEHARAVKVRADANNRIRRQCAATSFGLLCPVGNEAALDEAIEAARADARAFNDIATNDRISVYVLKGRISESDEEATRAIADEIRELLDQMERGVRGGEVKSIRDAATRAKGLASMLEEQQSAAVGKAIEEARRAARAIVKRVQKAGESAEVVTQQLTTGAIEKARFAFLDDAPETPEPGDDAPRMPSVAPQRFDMLWDDRPGAEV